MGLRVECEGYAQRQREDIVRYKVEESSKVLSTYGQWAVSIRQPSA